MFLCRLCEHGSHLGITFFWLASVRPSHFFVTSQFFFALSNNFFSTWRIGLELQTNVFINVCDGYTKGGYSKYFYMSYCPFSVKIYFFWKGANRWHMCCREHSILVNTILKLHCRYRIFNIFIFLYLTDTLNTVKCV